MAGEQKHTKRNFMSHGRKQDLQSWQEIARSVVGTGDALGI
jgi:hypothetical protein